MGNIAEAAPADVPASGDWSGEIGNLFFEYTPRIYYRVAFTPSLEGIEFQVFELVPVGEFVD